MPDKNPNCSCAGFYVCGPCNARRESKEALMDAADHSGYPMERVVAGAILSWLRVTGWEIARSPTPAPSPSTAQKG